MYNSYAGKFGRNGDSLVGRVAGILRNNGHNLTVVPTRGRGTAGGLAREHIARGADLIVAAGGDGTINEAAEGMLHSSVPLAILPGGTANVLANEIGLGTRIERAAARLEECRRRRISVGHLTCDGGRVSRHFLLMAGVGFDAYVVHHVDGELKSRTGKFAYWVAGLRLLGRRLEEFHVDIGGEQRQCSFALVSKVRNYGGDFAIARSVRLYDDRFEVVLFEGRHPVRYLKHFAGMMLNRLGAMKGVTVLRADCVSLSDPQDRCVYVQIDGEFAGQLPAEIRIVPDALTLLTPPGYGG
ncbi:MAG: diacylglycerol kinase family protein [Bryobacteraceae bacterium]